ncbi:hypothetical protein K402DRAFT_409615 [Aulographum hederae CBS 113979]|uniref:HMG box domain-containing protein n=1 Tax=Aulographum hederae CBS 113979 TaxID=1176131 RepID=A0A6G1HEL5_9PEZI|nr:hypothetical protein K402DRAFT_409615 [Aulographum hederae CBS 113979]
MSSDGSTDSADSASHVCLCQPDPKIPRPRNAFILYRQHHQANIVNQNPGLANPEISKIIGEQWRAQPASVKSDWKRLAEEEKARHQQQYPEYRYQPRRINTHISRGSTSEPMSAGPHSGSDKYRCKKCGGRSIISPTTPFSGSGPSSGGSQPPSAHRPGPILPPPTPSSAAIPRSRFLPTGMTNMTLASPHPASARPGGRIRDPPPSNVHVAGGQYCDDILSPMSPDAKRRRFNYPPPGSHPMQHPGVVQRPTTGTPYPYAPGQHPGFRRDSANLPRPQDLLRLGVVTRNGDAGSPPSTAGLMGPPQTPRRSDGGFGNLTLPPLQTSGHGARHDTPMTAHMDTAHPGQERSVEAMVMSISVLNKIKILRQIAPPLKVSAFGSPKSYTRGSVVAVEGENPAGVAQVVQWLAKFLPKSEECVVRLMDGPEVPGREQKTSLEQCLKVVVDWHGKQKDMIEFLTQPEGGTPTEADDETMEDAEEKESVPQKVEPQDKNKGKGRAKQAEKEPEKHSERGSDEDEEMDEPTTPTATKKVTFSSAEPTTISPTTPSETPVILIPHYQLRASNAYACRIPITDTYSPADHWQWMATLWRGIVGPDMTVIVREVAPGFKDASPAGEAKLVEIREDLRTLVVRKEKGRDLEERALRRVGFEVGEWVRGVALARP